MENKTSKKIKILMGLVLFMVVVPSAIDMAIGFSGYWEDIKSGFQEGQKQARNEWPQTFYVHLNPIGENEPVEEFYGGIQFGADRQSGELSVPTETASAWWVYVLNTFLALVVVISSILFVYRLIRFMIKLPRRRIMSDESTRALSGIGYSLGIFSLSAYLMEITQYIWLWNHIALDGYEIRMGLPPASLIVALIILAMTEILRAGTKLQKEQELTI